MKRFRIITIISLGCLVALIIGNIYYLHRLYNSLKDQALQTVSECVRRADILEIINRINQSENYGSNDSFIRLSLLVEGTKNEDGGYEYPNIMENIGQTMSSYFHLTEQLDTLFPARNYAVLDNFFRKELNSMGLTPEFATIKPIINETEKANNSLWSVDFSISNDQDPILKAYISPLNRHILDQMSGIIITSSAILLIMVFLIWYLLNWVSKLRTIEQMKDDFTHNMTHELKTPVAVAYSAADSLLRYYDPNDETRNKQFLKIILQRLNYLSGMIENILSMSMERFKSIKLNPENFELKPMVEEISEMIQLKADKNVNIEINVQDKLSIKADTLHFGNILSNLLDNSVKYSGDMVDITITADSNSITVSDKGRGIRKEDLPYIFDKFYRAFSGDIYEVGGYGLGLFYVKQIVELHGWHIDVDSQPGKGTSFTIYFKKHD